MSYDEEDLKDCFNFQSEEFHEMLKHLSSKPIIFMQS